MDIAPPDPAEDAHPFPRASNLLSVMVTFPLKPLLETDNAEQVRSSGKRVSVLGWVGGSRSSRISLLAHLNNGGNWDDIPRSKSVLELDMFFLSRSSHSWKLITLSRLEALGKG
jgi:hypothetical protein